MPMTIKKKKKNWIVQASFIILILTMITSVLACTLFYQYTVADNNQLNTQNASFNFEIRSDQNDPEPFTAIPVTPDEVNLLDYREAIDFSPSPGSRGNLLISIYKKSKKNPIVQIDFDETNPSALPIVYAYDGHFYSNITDQKVYLRLQNNHILEITPAGNLDNLEQCLGAKATRYFKSNNKKSNAEFSVKWFWSVSKDNVYQTVPTGGGPPELHYLETKKALILEPTPIFTLKTTLSVLPSE